MFNEDEFLKEYEELCCRHEKILYINSDGKLSVRDTYNADNINLMVKSIKKESLFERGYLL